MERKGRFLYCKGMPNSKAIEVIKNLGRYYNAIIPSILEAAQTNTTP